MKLRVRVQCERRMSLLGVLGSFRVMSNKPFGGSDAPSQVVAICLLMDLRLNLTHATLPSVP